MLKILDFWWTSGGPETKSPSRTHPPITSLIKSDFATLLFHFHCTTLRTTTTWLWNWLANHSSMAHIFSYSFCSLPYGRLQATRIGSECSAKFQRAPLANNRFRHSECTGKRKATTLADSIATGLPTELKIFTKGLQYEPPVAARPPTLLYAGASCFSTFPGPREVAGPLWVLP